MNIYRQVLRQKSLSGWNIISDFKHGPNQGQYQFVAGHNRKEKYKDGIINIKNIKNVC